MNRIPVESSTIKSVGHDLVNNQEVLEVEFKNKKQDTPTRIYQYFNVPRNVYDELISAESVGSYFCKNIQKKYEFVKVEE